ncbi:hypothetical protein AB0A69_16840 [Streptomyces sp. NPDC045431]|uniref:hypothetical protein n=1 Tax=Streptomyces sp. NPDC045431 TaxID=3155613 RepID=UPI0033DC919F
MPQQGSDKPVLGTPPWIDPNESLRYKEMYRELSHTVNGLATSLAVIKFDVTALALGLTVVKADFTLFKVDEKGMTFRGKQIATFPWADQKKHLENRIEQAERTEHRKLKALNEEVEKLKAIRQRVDEKNTEARASKDKTVVYETRAELSKLMRDAERTEKRIREKVAELGKTNALQMKLNRIKEMEKKAEEARKNVATDARKTRSEMNGLIREMRSVQNGLRNLSGSL